MPQHTPGPWKVLRANNGSIRLIVPQNGHANHPVCQIQRVHYPEPETAANALLIAASPQLLWAAEHFLDISDHMGEFTLTHLRTAVRLATGVGY